MQARSTSYLALGWRPAGNNRYTLNLSIYTCTCNNNNNNNNNKHNSKSNNDVNNININNTVITCILMLL